MPPRQQTLRSAIAWSYDWLDPREKYLFRRLGVFVGGFAPEAADAVTRGEGREARGEDRTSSLTPRPSPLDLLTALVDQGLVRREERGDGASRFTILETIRAYALERLVASGEALGTRRLHAEYYLSLAESAAPRLAGTEQAAWLNRLELEHDNLRAALAWCVEERDAERGLRLGAALWRFWYVRGHFTEGRQWLDRLLGLSGSAALPSDRASALNGAGNLAFNQTDYVAARILHEESLALRRMLDDRQGIAGSLNNLGLIAREQGDYSAARRMFEEAIAINRALGNRSWEAINLGNLGTVLTNQGRFEEARGLHEQSLAIFRELGDEWGSGMALFYLAEVACHEGNLGAARGLYVESLEKGRRVGDQRRIAQSLHGLGRLACRGGEQADAHRHFAEAVEIWRRLGNRVGMARCLEGLASVLVSRSQPAAAARLLGAAEALRETIGAVAHQEPDASRDQTIVAVRGTLSESFLETALNSGRAMSVDDAMAYATSVSAGA